MTGRRTTHTRDIARAAVRAELAQVAFELFLREGYDRVTINDIAAQAGVSRNTVLRYFGTKEEAVLGAFDDQGEQVAAALRARPADEEPWVALRHALDPILDLYHADPDGALAITRLVMGTPALCARHLEKQWGWRPALARVVAERGGTEPPGIGAHLQAAVALDCLNVAVNAWLATDGTQDLAELVDEAFATLRS